MITSGTAAILLWLIFFYVQVTLNISTTESLKVVTIMKGAFNSATMTALTMTMTALTLTITALTMTMTVLTLTMTMTALTMTTDHDCPDHDCPDHDYDCPDHDHDCLIMTMTVLVQHAST